MGRLILVATKHFEKSLIGGVNGCFHRGEGARADIISFNPFKPVDRIHQVGDHGVGRRLTLDETRRAPDGAVHGIIRRQNAGSGVGFENLHLACKHFIEKVKPGDIGIHIISGLKGVGLGHELGQVDMHAVDLGDVVGPIVPTCEVVTALVSNGTGLVQGRVCGQHDGSHLPALRRQGFWIKCLKAAADLQFHGVALLKAGDPWRFEPVFVASAGVLVGEVGVARVAGIDPEEVSGRLFDDPIEKLVRGFDLIARFFGGARGLSWL